MNPDPPRISNEADVATAPRCQHCDYPLVHLAESRCPECGREFNLRDASTFTDPAKLRPKRTVQSLIAMTLTVALLAIWPPDLGELIYRFIIATCILFAVARYFAITNDPYWLTPGFFFLGFQIVCWVQIWRLSTRYSVTLFDPGEALVMLIVGVVGTSALALMKAETHVLRKRGKTP